MASQPPSVRDYQQLFPSRASVSVPLDHRQDGTHRVSDRQFFEWWYFDAQLDSGHQLVVAVHTALFNVVSRPSVMAVHLYRPDGTKVVETIVPRPSEVESSSERCDIKMGSSRVRDAGDCYTVDVSCSKMRASLEYHPEAHGLQIGTGVLFSDSASGRSFHWVVPLPRATVSGWLWANGNRMAVKGVGYHDHNWGNLHLSAAFRGWIWGRAILDEYTLVFGRLSSHIVGLQVTPFALWRGPHLLLAGDRLGVSSTESTSKDEMGYRYPSQIELQIDEGALSVRSSLQARRVLDVIDFAQPRWRRESVKQVAETVYFLANSMPLLRWFAKRGIGHGTYLRFEANCELAVMSGGKQVRRHGHALCEVMDFGIHA